LAPKVAKEELIAPLYFINKKPLDTNIKRHILVSVFIKT
jgi:hypothetical protein